MKTATNTSRRNSTPTNTAIQKTNGAAASANANGKRRHHKKRAHGQHGNPFSTVGGLKFKNPGGVPLVPLFITAVGVVSTEFLAGRVLGPQSGVKGSLIKGGIGYTLARYGHRAPVIGPFAGTIGGALMLLAAVDLARQFVLPQIVKYVPVNFLPQLGGGTAAVGAPAAGGVAGLVGYNPPPNAGMSGLVDASMAGMYS
jgi:hypothetical protein